MSNYYIHAVILENCPYSIAAHKLLQEKQNIKTKITFVNSNNKDNYKTDQINTFPQIYLKKKNHNGSLLIGGYTELNNLFNSFYKKKYLSVNVTKYINDNNRWSKKTLLRFIELINS